MDYSDESYVRLYTRDTVQWRMLPWEAKAIWPQILRKFDRAGLLELGGEGVEGLAVLIEFPVDVVEPGIKALIQRGWLRVIDGDRLFDPAFLDRESAARSEKQRQRDSRERRQAEAKKAALIGPSSQNVTDGHGAELAAATPHARPEIESPPSGTNDGRNVTSRDKTAQNVTEAHKTGPTVTPGHDSSPCTVPVPIPALDQTPPPPAAGAAGGVPSPPVERGAAAVEPLELAPVTDVGPRRSKYPGPSIETLMRAWNERAHPLMPRVQEAPNLTGPMRTALRTRPLDGPTGWLALIDRMNASAFCRGEAGSSRRAMDLSFLLRHPADIANGKYDDRQAASGAPTAGREAFGPLSEREQRIRNKYAALEAAQREGAAR